MYNGTSVNTCSSSSRGLDIGLRKRESQALRALLWKSIVDDGCLQMAPESFTVRPQVSTSLEVMCLARIYVQFCNGLSGPRWETAE
jgi:hypothetical protein